MPKYCPNCGMEISERVKYCPSCGVKIEIFPLNKDKKSTIGGTSGSEDGTPNRDNSSLPLSECFFCGVKTSKIFYCPLCGHDFCYLHKLHRDHFCKENVPFEQQKFSNSNQTVRHSKGTIGRPIVVMIFVILAIIVGVVFALGTHLFPTGLDPTNPPITVGCVTESKTEATTIPQTSLPTEIPTQIQQYTYTIQVTRTPYPYCHFVLVWSYPRPPTGTIVSGILYVWGRR